MPDLVNVVHVPLAGRIVGRWARDPEITIHLADPGLGAPSDRILAARHSDGLTWMDGYGPRGPLFEQL